MYIISFRPNVFINFHSLSAPVVKIETSELISNANNLADLHIIHKNAENMKRNGNIKSKHIKFLNKETRK